MGIDEALNTLARSAVPTAERFAAMQQGVFTHIHAEARAQSLGRVGVAAAAALAMIGGLMAGAIGPRGAEPPVTGAIALAPSTLLVGG